MSFVKCAACPTLDGCIEAGQCLNTVVILHNVAAMRQQPRDLPPGSYTATVTSVQQSDKGLTVEFAVPGHKPVRATLPTPARGSVTEQIFAVCDQVLAEMWPEGSLTTPPEQRLAAARKQAIPRLEAAGVNGNSARKGSSMWIQARRDSYSK